MRILIDIIDGERLRAALRDVGKTQGDLAKFLHKDPSVISHIINGRRRATAEESEKIREFLTGEPGHTFEPRYGPIPVYGLAAASPGESLRLEHDAVLRNVPRHPAQEGIGGSFAVEVIGESMSPRYEHREIAYAIRDRWPRRLEDCIAEYANGDALVKIYLGSDDAEIRLRSLNPPKDFTVSRAQLKALHAVVGRGPSSS